MSISISFIRIVFMCLTVLLTGTYLYSTAPFFSAPISGLIGLGIGLGLSFAFISVDRFVRRFNLRAFIIALMGLFVGYLMGQAVILIVDAALQPAPEITQPLNAAILLFNTYLGMIFTARASESLYVCIPFVKLTPTTNKKKDIIIDSSILTDARIIDLAASGLLDQTLIMPRFIVNTLYEMDDDADESQRNRAHRSLEVLKKLEALPQLKLRYSDVDIPEAKDNVNKVLRLARLIDANILTADINRIQQSSVEGVTVINIHSLSNALKPMMQTGETINIKVQRYGKEPRQGVGYLEDGTMVVINGGGNFIGETIEVHVLSVKHTSSGRMIFSNAVEEGAEGHKPVTSASSSPRDYFLV